jgi:hypothetical protein
VTLRFDTLLLSVIFALAVLVRRFRAHPLMLLGCVALVFLSALSPIEITPHNVPGPPRLVGCCGGMPLHPEISVQGMAEGRCVYCSDIVSGFEPDHYLVW